MRNLYIKRERALACFALAYRCVIGRSKEEYLQWLQTQDRSALMTAQDAYSIKNGGTICVELDEEPTTLFVIACQEHGALMTPVAAIPPGREDLYFVVLTVYDGNRKLCLDLKQEDR